MSRPYYAFSVSQKIQRCKNKFLSKISILIDDSFILTILNAQPLRLKVPLRFRKSGKGVVWWHTRDSLSNVDNRVTPSKTKEILKCSRLFQILIEVSCLCYLLSRFIEKYIQTLYYKVYKSIFNEKVSNEIQVKYKTPVMKILNGKLFRIYGLLRSLTDIIK